METSISGEKDADVEFDQISSGPSKQDANDAEAPLIWVPRRIVHCTIKLHDELQSLNLVAIRTRFRSKAEYEFRAMANMLPARSSSVLWRTLRRAQGQPS